MKIAYLGPQASYTHQAALKAFHQVKSDVELLPRSTIEDVFAAVQHGDSQLAVVPFENSSNGSVVFTLDLFVDQAGKHADIIVVDEIYLPVSHCLVGRAQSNETADKGEVRQVSKVYSHPQAWGQCKRYLAASIAGVERQDVSSTSRAAEIVAGEKAGTSAAISSKLAAEMNGLDVLAEGIEDNKGNTTRFLVLSRLLEHDPVERQPRSGTSFKTMISITIDHTAPGALADALAVFKQYNINLTSISTRPSGQRNWMYVFFVEFRGHKEDSEVKKALNDLQHITKTYRWLGSWRDALIESE